MPRSKTSAPAKPAGTRKSPARAAPPPPPEPTVKRGPGRPTKLTEDLVAKLCELLERGNPITTACAVLGLGERTFYDWRTAGDADLEADLDTDFSAFSQRVRASEARAEAKAMDIVQDAMLGGQWVEKSTTVVKELVKDELDPDWGPGEAEDRDREMVETDSVLLERTTTTQRYRVRADPRLAIWYLQTRNRREFGKNLALTGADGSSPVKIETDSGINLTKLSDHDLDALEALLEAGRGARDGAEPGAGAP